MRCKGNVEERRRDGGSRRGWTGEEEVAGVCQFMGRQKSIAQLLRGSNMEFVFPAVRAMRTGGKMSASAMIDWGSTSKILHSTNRNVLWHIEKG